MRQSVGHALREVSTSAGCGWGDERLRLPLVSIRPGIVARPGGMARASQPQTPPTPPFARGGKNVTPLRKGGNLGYDRFMAIRNSALVLDFFIRPVSSSMASTGFM